MNDVLSRPLFRQAGGPILPQSPGLAPSPSPVPMPPAMPPQMPPAMPPQMPPQMPAGMGMMEDPTQQAEMEAEAEMEQAGAEYMSGVFSGIDNAETAEELINALRGEDRPIGARYEELAMIVGPEDASNTPDSVLALAQPGIMMATGGVDGGIGMLVEDLTIGADMVTPGGEPTDMGQGVGGLMMAGAEPMPMDPGPMPMGPEMGMAPQYLAMGGPVIKKFQNAGAVNGGTINVPTSAERIKEITSGLTGPVGIATQYDQLLPLYTDIIGSSDDSRKSQAQLALAQAAFDWGAGKYAGTGRSPFAQGAEAISSTLPTLSAISSAKDKEEQAVKLSALKSASDLESAARTTAGQIAMKRLELMTGTAANRSIQQTSREARSFMEQFREQELQTLEGENLKLATTIVDKLIDTKAQRGEFGNRYKYSFTADEVALFRLYQKTLERQGIDTSAITAILADIEAKGPIKRQLSGEDGEDASRITPKGNPPGVEELLDRAAGWGVKRFNTGGEALKDPGDPAMLISGSNIVPSIANYAYGAVGQPLPYPEQRQARNYYREMVAKYNRQLGDIMGSFVDSDRMSVRYETPLAEQQKTTFPPEGGISPTTWIGDEAALRDIVSKRDNVEQRIVNLAESLQTLGTREPALTDTAISERSLQIEQLKALRDEMDVFTAAMAKSMRGQGAARNAKREAVRTVQERLRALDNN